MHVRNLGYAFVLVMFYKCATCSVVCEIWRYCGIREDSERLLRRQGKGVLFESTPWYGNREIGGVFSIQVHLQITSRVRLVVLYYINFTTGADVTISVR